MPKRVQALISHAQGIAKRMTGNPSFPNPAPTLAAVMAAINELQIAETGALSRTKGAVVLRNEKRTTLVGVLQQLRAYVQSIADADATNAASIIESAVHRAVQLPRGDQDGRDRLEPARVADDALSDLLVG
jgi:hypothetical protein